ncbi:MAG: efflux RND transporter periplasmic adaptor subunit [Bryobacteraceae bacterium]
MKRKWKITLFVVLLLVVAGGIFASIRMNQKGVVTVQTGKSVRQDLASIVTASGEIKPKNYVNIGADVLGRITALEVAEGDRVKKHQVVARLEAVQAEADVQAQRAALNSSEADSSAAEAGLLAQDENVKTQQATIDRAKAELEKAQQDFKRSQELYKSKLISRQDFDSSSSNFNALTAGVREAEARMAQLKAQRQQTAAQMAGAQRRVSQSQATLRRFTDVLSKHNAVSPIDGMVTNLPVRVGESLVPGVQNTQGSLIMTIADMSLITAEVKVDETDIVNVKLDQQAEITIDAMPGRSFKGHVIEIGNTAILRSTGLAASQSAISSQEAKDFKVVVALDNAPPEIRPGLSCTAKVTTATRQRALTIPIQALTVRQKGDLEAPKPGEKKDATPAAKLDPAAEKAKKEEIQGVFVVSGEKAEFRKVETGITGATDIEVLNGLKEGDEIITGSYKIIRTLKPDAKIKVDNKAPVKAES